MNLSWDERLSGWCCDCVVGAKEVLHIICLILMMMKMMTMIMMDDGDYYGDDDDGLVVGWFGARKVLRNI